MSPEDIAALAQLHPSLAEMLQRNPEQASALIEKYETLFQRGQLPEAAQVSITNYLDGTANLPTAEQLQALDLYPNSPETLQAAIEAQPDGQQPDNQPEPEAEAEADADAEAEKGEQEMTNDQ